MAMAQKLYPGCDVWLNNPLRPLEACGTSGMKAALNGCLNLSVLDGWWDEWYDPDFGWAIPTADGGGDLTAKETERRDALEATALYELLEERVAPRFYERGREGLPDRWIGMVRETLTRLGPKVIAGRMVREYVETLYAPAARAHRALGPEQARELAAYKERVRSGWAQVAVEHVDAGADGPDGDGAPAQLGATLALRVRVRLGELAPEDVEVQAVSGHVDGDDRISGATRVPLKPAPGGPDLDGRWTFEGPLALDRTGSFGYTVRVLPSHRLLASGAEMGLIAVPTEAAGQEAGVLLR
ncbi:hypothetical protein ACFQVA_30435 [Actinomadura keratinilytica]